MTDAQLRRRLIIKRMLIVSAVLLLLSMGMLYFQLVTQPQLDQYKAEKNQEVSFQNQLNTLSKANAELLATITENGKELVSFTEDKIKYINLASELSLSNNVRINKLTVSDVWDEGEMSGITTSIEVEGNLHDIRTFVEQYCGTQYINRIDVVSCRPSGRYVWLERRIDGQNVLGWFDLADDEQLYDELLDAELDSLRQQAAELGLTVDESKPSLSSNYIYDPKTGLFKDEATGAIVTQEMLDETPITLDKMFAEKPVKVYLVIDFLGRA